MSDDNIKRYVKTVNDGLKGSCPTCAAYRPLWVGETEGGELLTCCCFCQRVLNREPVPVHPGVQ